MNKPSPNCWKPAIILWDLDGTLAYWESLRVIPAVAGVFWARLSRGRNRLQTLLSTARAYHRVLTNQSEQRNDDLFNHALGRSLGAPPQEIEHVTREMISGGHLDEAISRFIRPIPYARHLVEELARLDGYRQVVATNPVMPSEFNRRRLGIAGFDVSWFRHITGSEWYSRQKHDPRFFHELLALLHVGPRECLMIGNDARKDLTASAAGIPCFLLESEHTRTDPGCRNVPDWKGDYGFLRHGLLQGFPPPGTGAVE